MASLGTPDNLMNEIARCQADLDQALAHMYYCRTVLGSLPPQPPTLRGRIGRFLVKAVQRALFWLMPQLDAFNAASINMMQKQLASLDALSKAHLRMEQECRESMMEMQNSQRRLENIIREKSALPDLSASRPRGDTDDIRRTRAAIEQDQARIETLVWIEAMKWRAQIDDLSRKLSESSVSGAR